MKKFFCNGKQDICYCSETCTDQCEFFNGEGGYEEEFGSSQNPYWERICKLSDRQRDKGISKYGYGIECDFSCITQRLEWLEEELIDGLMYIEHIKEWLKDVETNETYDNCNHVQERKRIPNEMQ